MVELFNVKLGTISYNLNEIYESRELEKIQLIENLDKFSKK